jgi:putative thiamine transport system permease protein
MLGPIAAGLAGTVLPAFGWFPTLGGTSFGLHPFAELFAQPGIGRSIGLSIWTGGIATLISLGIALGVTAAGFGTRWMAVIMRGLSPLLSVPHATLALGLVFLISPSGWLVRAISPWATGWNLPPDALIVNDPNGLAMIVGLILKETPFLFLMILAASDGLDAGRYVRQARTLGYRPMTAWIKTVLPRLYPRIRLPVLAVLAFSVSVVDVAIVLGPGTPAPLAPRVIQWANDPDLGRQFLAAAGAVVQLALAALAIALWLAAERICAGAFRGRLSNGGRGTSEAPFRAGLISIGVGLIAIAALALAGLVVWSGAGIWRFPAVLPDSLSLDAWTKAWARADILEPLAVTTVTALASAMIAAVVAIGCLEHETRTGKPPSRNVAILLYLPLLVPQIAFLFGVQILLVATALDGGWAALIWAHLIFVLPYVFLSMAGPWRRLDPRWRSVARTLGHGPNRVLFRVTLPMLARPVLIALAVGIAVSVAQYLPTVFAGAGRLTTLTTEAVALSSGGDRRVIGVYGLLQMALPMVAFVLAHLAANLITRPRVIARPTPAALPDRT